MFYKLQHLRDILRIRRITERNLRARGFLSQPAVNQDKPADSPLPEVQLPRQSCIPVLQGLMHLLLAMDFTCHVDLFLVTCKVILISRLQFFILDKMKKYGISACMRRL